MEPVAPSQAGATGSITARSHEEDHGGAHEHAFVDESTLHGVTLVACVLVADDVERARRSMRERLLPQQTHVHLTRESPGRRREIIKVIADSGVRFRAYAAPSGVRPRDARDDCLRRIVRDLAMRGVQRLTIELDEGARLGDLKTVYEEVRAQGRAGVLEYSLLPKTAGAAALVGRCSGVVLGPTRAGEAACTGCCTDPRN